MAPGTRVKEGEGFFGESCYTYVCESTHRHKIRGLRRVSYVIGCFTTDNYPLSVIIFRLAGIVVRFAPGVKHETPVSSNHLTDE